MEDNRLDVDVFADLKSSNRLRELAAVINGRSIRELLSRRAF
jgi:hypothetical protein